MASYYENYTNFLLKSDFRNCLRLCYRNFHPLQILYQDIVIIQNLGSDMTFYKMLRSCKSFVLFAPKKFLIFVQKV